MFGLSEVSKTFFPHLLHFSVYENYKGDYPDISSYDVDNMNHLKRTECIEWLDQMKQEGQVFNYKENMIEYCINDVEVLRQCGEKFRELFKNHGRVDPFIDGMTLSHSVSLVYRKLHMIPDSIAVIPPWGYKPCKKYSNKAVNWLHYISRTTGVEIKHARNGGEKKLH